jgi:exopolysaccharide biosynthesis polyprenyl glycosylphosphotransferase
MFVCGGLAGAEPGLRAAICVSTAIAFGYLSLLRLRLTVSWLDDLPRLTIGCAIGLAAGVAVRHDVSPHPLARDVFAGAVMAAAVLAARAVIYHLARRVRCRVKGSATLILGTGEVGRRLGRAILDHPEHGLRLVGYVDSERRRRASPPAPLLGDPRQLGRLIEELGVRRLIVTFGSGRVATLVDVLRTCDRSGCEILLVPRLYELHTASRDTEHVRGLPLIPLRRAPFRRPSWRVKRAIDVLLASVALVVLSPVLIACAVAVRIEGGPGVLFRQERVGLDARRFQMFKFRSLKAASESEADLKWTVARDPRIGPVGRLMRSTSLDELPQLVNVLRGDMSLVGPRPERPHFVETFRQHLPRYDARHRVPAGLTGWAAVNGLRGDTSISERIECDNIYIQNWSLWFDVKILIRTIGAVLGRTGA